MKKLRVGVLASGRGSNLQAIIDSSLAGGIDVEVAVVVSDVADAQALERARSAGIPAVHVPPGRFRTKLTGRKHRARRSSVHRAATRSCAITWARF